MPSIFTSFKVTLALSSVARFSVTTLGKIKLMGLRSIVPPRRSTRTLPLSSTFLMPDKLQYKAAHDICRQNPIHNQ